MKITLVNQSEKSLFLISEKKIQKLGDLIFHNLKQRNLRNKKKLWLSELTCVFLSKNEMKLLNKSFRKINKPTDVLSFQPLDNASLGELVFCPEVLVFQAKKQKHSLSDELMYMFIHGLLHLLGYDHEISRAEEKIMFKLQDLVFAQLTQTKLPLKYIDLKQ